MCTIVPFHDPCVANTRVLATGAPAVVRRFTSAACVAAFIKSLSVSIFVARVSNA